MSDQYVGEIRMFAANAVPNGWLPCDGQLLKIADQTAVYSLLGTTYGGNGTTYFALPDLRGAAMLGAVFNDTLSKYPIGTKGGQSTVTLTGLELPAHSHPAMANPVGSQEAPGYAIWGNPAGRPPPNFFSSQPVAVAMNPVAIGTAGGDQPHNNLMPYTVFVFCIALQGEFPSRG